MPCLASNKEVFYIPGAEYVGQYLSASPDQRIVEIFQNRFINPSSWDHYYELANNIFSKNDVILFQAALRSDIEGLGIWYKSEESIMYVMHIYTNQQTQIVILIKF